MKQAVVDWLVIAAGLVVMTTLHQFWLGTGVALHFHAMLIGLGVLVAMGMSWWGSRDI